jgi:hypothetical protein
MDEYRDRNGQIGIYVDGYVNGYTHTHTHVCENKII